MQTHKDCCHDIQCLIERVLILNVLSKSLHGENEEISPVSVIIDESTDKGTTKCLAIITKPFDEKALRVNTRLLNLVPVQEEMADEEMADENRSCKA